MKLILLLLCNITMGICFKSYADKKGKNQEFLDFLALRISLKTDDFQSCTTVFNAISATVVISSPGGAALHHRGLLGQYEFHEDEDKGYYVQTSTDQKDESFQASVLFRDEDDVWTVWKSGRWLRNPRPSKTLPSSGWQYWGGGWQDDLTLTVSLGPLPPLPGSD